MMDPELEPSPAPLMELPLPEEVPVPSEPSLPVPEEKVAEGKKEEISVPSSEESLPHGRKYPSLYDSTGTTIIAIVLGIVIVGGIQFSVQRIYAKARSEHEILTRFVVTIVALVIGAYITDLLIAGPDTKLLSEQEHTIILSFIKDICLMVFAFYFGTKASKSETPAE